MGYALFTPPSGQSLPDIFPNTDAVHGTPKFSTLSITVNYPTSIYVPSAISFDINSSNSGNGNVSYSATLSGDTTIKSALAYFLGQENGSYGNIALKQDTALSSYSLIWLYQNKIIYTYTINVGYASYANRNIQLVAKVGIKRVGNKLELDSTYWPYICGYTNEGTVQVPANTTLKVTIINPKLEVPVIFM